MILTPPLSALDTMAAYARSAFDTSRRRFVGVNAALPRDSSSLRRSASWLSESCTLMVRRGMSISMVSPSRTSPIAPPAAASGEMWPIDSPEVPPEKRPSVMRAHSLPRWRDLMYDVG